MMIWVALYLYVLGTVNAIAILALVGMVTKAKVRIRWWHLIWPISQPLIAIAQRITRR